MPRCDLRLSGLIVLLMLLSPAPRAETVSDRTAEASAQQQATDDASLPLQTEQADQPPIKQLAEIQVKADGRAKNLIGIAGSASQGEVSQRQFEYRPLSRNGELVEVVPGALATQHSGSGKANQYFLRGFNLDHGTDFTTIVDGIQMNMPSHTHGQGYMDINSVIPELVSKVEYGKGPYYGEVGDFSAAGFSKMSSADRLKQALLKFTAGSFAYYRTLAARSSRLGEGDLLYAAEFNLYDGVWQQPENAGKFNGILRYSLDQENWGLHLNAKGYTNSWIATNQIAQTDINNGSLGLYGSMSPSDGGKTNRYSVSGNLWNKGNDWKNDANLYLVYYDISLYNNFTGYLNGPLGDQIDQYEHRLQSGGNLEHSRHQRFWGLEMDNSIGVNFRHDQIMGIGTDYTLDRQFISTLTRDNIGETTAGAFVKNETHWLEKLRTVSALRGDFLSNDVTALANGYTGSSRLCALNPGQLGCYLADPLQAAALNAANSGHSAQILVSPKFSLVLGPWFDTEYFVNIGYGYHSNDARGTVQSLFADPLANGALTATGSKVSPMSWGRGGELGLRSNAIKGLNSTVAFWWLQSSEELVFDGETGTTAANGKSNRYGMEWTNYYQPFSWLTLDADLALTTARYAQMPEGCVSVSDPGISIACTSSAIANSVGRVVSAGATVVDPGGWFGSIRLRHFGDMPLDNQGTWAPATSVVNLGAGYKHNNYKVEIDLFNLFDSQANDIAYAYTSQYPYQSSAKYGLMKHPVEPRMLRGTITVNF